MQLLLLCMLLVPMPPLQARPDDVLVERVDVRGNRRIPEDTIRFYIQSRPGERYDEGRLELDLRALYKSNFFEYIEIDEKDGDTGKVVTFILREKPLIRSIQYAGAKSFTESNILEHFKDKKVGLTVDSQYDPAKIRTAERSLRDLMQLNGKPLGTVRTEVTSVPPSGVRVRFVLDEGPKVRIGAIRFTGNTKMSDGALKDALKLTKERSLMSLFKGTDKFHAGKLEADVEMNLKAFYKENGYMQVQVGQPMTRICEGPRGFIPMLRKTRLQYLIELPDRRRRPVPARGPDPQGLRRLEVRAADDSFRTAQGGRGQFQAHQGHAGRNQENLRRHRLHQLVLYPGAGIRSGKQDDEPHVHVPA